ncbi:MAG: hypothetical protein NTY80_00020 [candidate division SR1 bacterium]|nr:hypothetical protein [candidate division SR1 bacterium]
MNAEKIKNIPKESMNKETQEIIINIAKQLFLCYIIDERKIGKKRVQKIGKKISSEERDVIVSNEFPYLRKKQSFQNYLLEKYRKEENSTYKQYSKAVFSFLQETIYFNEFIYTLKKKKIVLSQKEREILKNYFIQEVEKSFSCSPLSLSTMNMTLISSYKSLADIITKDATIENETKRKDITSILGKRIEDSYIEFTIPANSREKNKQTVEALEAENIITFCCPDYRYYLDEERNMRCDTSCIGDEIGSFGDIIIRTAKKTIPDLYTLGKLKKLTIIMPSYQIYLSPNETNTYDNYCEKLMTTANKIKTELDKQFSDRGIKVEINCILSNEIYSDQEIYGLKNQITPLIESYIGNEFSDFYNKIIGVETNYQSETNENKIKDILVSDIAEGQLLVERLGKETLYLLPEDEKMLRPQLVYMIQNQEMKKDINKSIGGLPTLIIQNTSFA